MKSFKCGICSNQVYFENTQCAKCGADLGFEPLSNKVLARSNYPDSGSAFVAIDGTYRYCQNAQQQACNWLVEDTGVDAMCQACELNRTIPNLLIEEHAEEWRKIEKAKHRLIYSLQRFRLPIIPKTTKLQGFCFDFLADQNQPQGEDPVRTGHKNGVITINISEADAVYREQIKKDMAEPYRTLLGHFRHEIAHYYWQLLIVNDLNWLNQFRTVFGDERKDYQEALRSHYNSAASANWTMSFISKYASSHPWEDWAETWAHYFHLVDMLDTAIHFGLDLGIERALRDPYSHTSFEDIFENFVPLALVINSINRSMGQPDLYPFVIPTAVKVKMEFVHQIIKMSAINQ